jgi:hypothetical protein
MCLRLNSVEKQYSPERMEVKDFIEFGAARRARAQRWPGGHAADPSSAVFPCAVFLLKVEMQRREVERLHHHNFSWLQIRASAFDIGCCWG